MHIYDKDCLGQYNNESELGKNPSQTPPQPIDG